MLGKLDSVLDSPHSDELISVEKTLEKLKKNANFRIQNILKIIQNPPRKPIPNYVLGDEEERVMVEMGSNGENENEKDNVNSESESEGDEDNDDDIDNDNKEDEDDYEHEHELEDNHKDKDEDNNNNHNNNNGNNTITTNHNENVTHPSPPLPSSFVSLSSSPSSAPTSSSVSLSIPLCPQNIPMDSNAKESIEEKSPLSHLSSLSSSVSSSSSSSSASLHLSLPRFPLSLVISHLVYRWSLGFLELSSYDDIGSTILVSQMLFHKGGYGAIPFHSKLAEEWILRAVELEFQDDNYAFKGEAEDMAKKICNEKLLKLKQHLHKIKAKNNAEKSK